MLVQGSSFVGERRKRTEKTIKARFSIKMSWRMAMWWHVDILSRILKKDAENQSEVVN